MADGRGVAATAALLPVVVALAECGVTEPPAGRWTSLGLEGKWVTAVADTPWGLVPGTRDDGVCRLDSAGAPWRSLGLAQPSVYCLLMVPASPPRLLAGVGIRTPRDPRAPSVLATEDGVTWSAADGDLSAQGGGSGFSLAVDSANPTRLFFGDGANVLRSEDGGASWALVLGDPAFAGNGAYRGRGWTGA